MRATSTAKAASTPRPRSATGPPTGEQPTAPQTASSNSFSVAGYWQPLVIGIVPLISAGSGINDPLSLELFYKFQVTDNISITPGLFYITNSSNQVNDKDLWGGVIQTQFRF